MCTISGMRNGRMLAIGKRRDYRFDQNASVHSEVSFTDYVDYDTLMT